MSPERDIETERVPGGSLLAAALNRNVMGLADRGGSSGIIGSRWADLAAVHADRFIGQHAPIPRSDSRHTIDRVARLDSEPRIARRASRLGLQNPDLIFFGNLNGSPTVQAVDAKFSIETARSRQVSTEMMEALRGLGPVLDDVVGGFGAGTTVLPGLFISPDSAITRHVLRRGRGITKLTVDPGEVLLMEISASEMFAGGEERDIVLALSRVDALPVTPFANLLAGLYYFRLARAGIAASIDMQRPLLSCDDRFSPDLRGVLADAENRIDRATSAWSLITTWIDEADGVNRQRSAIDRVAGLPVSGKELREWIEADAGALGSEAPSVNQVKRRLGHWHRRQLRDVFGPLMPPRHDLGNVLEEIGRFSRELGPQMRPRTADIVAGLIAEREQATGDGMD